MDKAHHIKNIKIDGDTLTLNVNDNEYLINICEHSTLLASSSAKQRSHFIVSPSGYGIHWPDIDEDLSIDSLLNIKHSQPQLQEPIQYIHSTNITQNNESRIVAENKTTYK